jgi:hypothetical protein
MADPDIGVGEKTSPHVARKTADTGAEAPTTPTTRLSVPLTGEPKAPAGDRMSGF